tara:strand:- start:154 stop:483 length:330 start_codon:yes stop_codon:yes gene_type:complete
MLKKIFVPKKIQTNSIIRKKNKDILKILKTIINENSQIIRSLGKNYSYSYKKKQLKKYKNASNFRIIGMGGSILGAHAIYDFLKHKISKNFLFINNLQNKQKREKKKIY